MRRRRSSSSAASVNHVECRGSKPQDSRRHPGGPPGRPRPPQGRKPGKAAAGQAGARGDRQAGRLGEKALQGLAEIPEAADMGDFPGDLGGEAEVLRDGFAPAPVGVGPVGAVEGGVDLHHREEPGIARQVAVPGREKRLDRLVQGPAGDADAGARAAVGPHDGKIKAISRGHPGGASAGGDRCRWNSRGSSRSSWAKS